MQITLSNGLQIEVKNINLAQGTVDWRRLNGEYNGDCMSAIAISSLAAAEAEITAALEAEQPIMHLQVMFG